MGSKDTGGHGGGSQARKAGGRVGSRHEDSASGEVRSHQSNVDQILSRQVHGSAAHDTVELAESHGRSSEGDRTNEGAKVNRSLVHGVKGSVIHSTGWIRHCHVARDRGGSGSETDQGVESSHHLRQVGDLHGLGEGDTGTTTESHGPSELTVDSGGCSHVSNGSGNTGTPC